MRYRQFLSWSLVILAGWFCGTAYAQDLVRNGSFEVRDGENAQLPANWGDADPGTTGLSLASEHHQGATSAVLVADGKEHIWRQKCPVLDQRTFTLSALVKAEGVSMIARDDYAMLYGHILYRGRLYAEATHFYVRILPGTYDWKVVSVSGVAANNEPIECVLVSLVGKISAGRVYFDEVRLTPERSLEPDVLLGNKVADLKRQLLRVGPVDESVIDALTLLNKSQEAIAKHDLPTAREHWQGAAGTVSHKVWTVMFPTAVGETAGPEARMIYHGLAPDQAGCDRYLNTMVRANCNGVYHSLGSWMGVVHHSSLLPVEPQWRQFDALEYSIGIARQHGIKSFAYVAALYGTTEPPADSRLRTEHPDWFAHGPDRNMPTFPDPANPEVADFIVKVYTELATKYDLDGIGLDYIRYPSPTALNYDERNRKEILSRYGIDISQGEPWRDPAKWEKIREYRAEKVGAIVRRVRESVKAAKPSMAIMACLISDPDEAFDYGQRWAVSGKWIDYLSPMNYDAVSGDLSLLKVQKRVATESRAVWIPAIGGMPSLHESRTITEWADAVAAQRASGADGMIIYRMGGLDPAVAAFFGNGPFHGKAAFPEPRK
jgi:uncharacterized lipoprotein YddW (UPF0748 family)